MICPAASEPVQTPPAKFPVTAGLSGTVRFPGVPQSSAAGPV